jgi:hypothetical protein
VICVACWRMSQLTNDADMVLNGDSLCLTHAEKRMATGDRLYAEQQKRQQQLVQPC